MEKCKRVKFERVLLFAFLLFFFLGTVSAVQIGQNSDNSVVIGVNNPMTKTVTITKACVLDLGILSCSTCSLTYNEGSLTSTTC